MYSLSHSPFHGVFLGPRNLGDSTLVGTNTMHIYQYLFTSYPVRYDDSSMIREVIISSVSTLLLTSSVSH